MAKKKDPLSFNFGANKKKTSKPKKSGNSKRKGTGNRSNAWRQYVGSSAPIPD
jgi:hypothetical protein